MHTDEFEERPELVRKRARAEMLARGIQIAWFLLVVLVIVLLFWNLHKAEQVRNSIADCVTPGGQCYHRSIQQRNELVHLIHQDESQRSHTTRRIVILAASCADQPGSDSANDILQCIHAGLEK